VVARLAVFALFVLLVAAMWKRPNPNHIFALQMLKCLGDEEPQHQSRPWGLGLSRLETSHK